MTINTLQIAALFLGMLGLGSATMYPLIPMRDTGKTFTRFYYALILILIGGFLACLYRLEQFHTNYIFSTLLAVWIWILSLTKTATKIEEYLHYVFAVFAFCLLVIYVQKFVFPHDSTPALLFKLLLLLSATAFLAFHLMNMIFGHSYLTNRTLPITHLIRTTKILTFVSWIRVATVAAGTYFAFRDMDPEKFARLTDFMGHGIFFWSRILAGLGIPVLVSHLAYSSAKIGSNQSATGILYAGIVFVFMGEVMALYLFSITGYLF